jgi:Tfp pilus assembly protein FimT
MRPGQRFCTSNSSPSAAAFSVVELLVAAAIVAIISIAALPIMTETIRGYRVRSMAWQIAEDLRLARARAVSASRRHRLCFSNCGEPVPRNGYLIQREDGSGWAVEAVLHPSVQGVQVTSNATITFADTGEAAGGTVTVAHGAHTMQVRTHYTGRIKVCSGVCS